MAFVQWRVDWWPGTGSRIWPLPSPGRSSATAGAAATSTEQRPHCSIISHIVARSSKSDMNPGASRTTPDHHIAQDDPRSPGFAIPDQLRPASAKRDALQPTLPGYSLRPSKTDTFSKKQNWAHYRCSTAIALLGGLQSVIDLRRAGTVRAGQNAFIGKYDHLAKTAV